MGENAATSTVKIEPSKIDAVFAALSDMTVLAEDDHPALVLRFAALLDQLSDDLKGFAERLRAERFRPERVREICDEIAARGVL